MSETMSTEQAARAEYLEELLQKARAAQKVFETFSQKDTDKAARAAGKAVYDNARTLALEAIKETSMGNLESKLAKMGDGLTYQWLYAKDKKSKGVIGWEKGKLDVDCILKIAKPIGVVGAIQPTTNPTSTMASNAMQALKTGNAIIVCPHPRAKNVSIHCCELMREAIAAVGAPRDLIQIIEMPSIEMTEELISMVDVVVATGGSNMVKAAYSSGHPSLGVGQGNCQVVVDKNMNADFPKIAAGFVRNRSYDNGIPCTGEQQLILPACDKEELLAEMDKAGAYIIEDEGTIEKIRRLLFKYKERTGEYAMDPAIVGFNVYQLAELLGITIPEGKKIMLVKLEKYGADELLSREKLCPVSGYYTYEGDWANGVKIAKANLELEGAGHSSDVYSNDESHQIYAGEQLPVCRLIINNCNKVVAGTPYYTNGMVPSGGIGCGYWGGNSIGENMNFTYLLNYTRLFYTVEGKDAPTHEEIWAED